MSNHKFWQNVNQQTASNNQIQEQQRRKQMADKMRGMMSQNSAPMQYSDGWAVGNGESGLANGIDMFVDGYMSNKQNEMMQSMQGAEQEQVPPNMEQSHPLSGGGGDMPIGADTQKMVDRMKMANASKKIGFMG